VKWLLGIVVLVAIAAAALFGVGYFLVPTKTEISRSITIERPTSIIYPLVANLRSFNEVSPWFDRDPKADYTFRGPREGVGQSASWASSVRAVGSGSQKIVAVKENEQVTLDLNLNGRAAKAVWKFAPVEAHPENSEATWSVTVDCGTDPRNVPCRYLTLLARSPIKRDIDFALAALKRTAEKLPALEIASLTPEFVTVRELDFAFVEGDTGRDDAAIDAALRDSFVLVSGFLKANNLAQAGPPMAVNIVQSNERTSFRAGMPYTGATPVTQLAVKTGKTPSGLALKVVASGSRAAMKPVYARIDAYLLAHRLKPSGGPWEVYVDDASVPDAQRRTAIYYPLTDPMLAPAKLTEKPATDEQTQSAAPQP
jgi:hypothetical protein